MPAAGEGPRAWSVHPGRWGTLLRRPGDGPRLLLLPGLGCPAGHFAAEAPARLPGSWELWVWEAPGAGRTSFRGRGQETMGGLAEALASAIEGAGPEAGPPRSLTVVGHSMGGLVGLLLCEGRPDAVDGFVNVEGNLGPGDCVFTASVVEHSWDTFRRRWLPENIEALRASEETGSRAYAEALADLASPAAYFRHSHALVRASRRPGLAQRFLDLDLPRLYVHGARSGDPATLALLRSSCPVVAIPGAGHFPHLDRPGAFFARLRRFVEELDAGGRP